MRVLDLWHVAHCAAKYRAPCRAERLSRCTLAALGSAAWLLTATSASADVRSGRAAPTDAAGSHSSPTHPVLREVQVRYDADAGRIDATVVLVEALAGADSSTAGLLAAWRVQVSFGDWLHDGNCSGDEGTRPQITAALGDEMPGVYEEQYDEFSEDGAAIPVPVTKTYSADRSVVTLSVSHPRLQRVPLICAEARVFETHDEMGCSCTEGFALGGFSALDGGAAARETARVLEWQVFGLAFAWSEFSVLLLETSCTVRRGPGELACWVPRVRIEAIPGKPALTLEGTVTVSPERRRAWDWKMRGALKWRRCPNHTAVPSRLRGKPCRIRLRWRGTSSNLPGAGNGRDLADLIPKSRGLKAARPA